MFKFLRKNRVPTNETVGFEPEEHSTPFLGRVLLVFLAVALLFFGWSGLEDLGDIPQKPQNLSECSGYYSYRSGRVPEFGIEPAYPGDKFQNYDYTFERYPSCTFSSFEEEAGVPEAYRAARTVWAEREAKRKTAIAPLETQLAALNRSITLKDQEYNTALRESVAGEPAVGKTPEQLRNELQILRTQKTNLEKQISDENAKLASLSSDLKIKTAALDEKIKEAQKKYNRAWAGYKLWVFFLELVFVVPSFGVAMWFWFRLMRRDSPHTVILIPIVIATGVLLLRTLLVYFWALFLADLVELLFELIARAAILRTLFFYFGMVMSVVIFGGLVYLIQKKVYAPGRVKARRLRAKKCPYCESPYEFTKTYCPGCGKQILEKCSQCSQARYIDLKYCPHCGKP